MVTEVIDTEENKRTKKNTKSNSSAPNSYQKNWDLLVMYVDLYKHHFDLSLKAFVLYLAIIATVGGFVFRQDMDFKNRVALLIFAIIASFLAFICWATAFLWARTFGIKVNILCKELHILPMPMFGAKVVLFLKALSSLITLFGGIYLLQHLY